MSAHLDNLTYTVSADRIGQLSDIQHRAMVLLGRLRVLKDGSIEAEDDFAADALEALSQRLSVGVSREATVAVEDRSGMPWSVFVGQCISWWEGYGQARQGGSTCMPRGLAPQAEPETKPQVVRPKRVNDREAHALQAPLGSLSQQGRGLSVWQPNDESDGMSPLSHARPRPPVPPIPFLAVLVERIGSLDVFFEGLQWNKGRRVMIRRASAPIWPIIVSALLAIMFSGQLWWAPWPIMSLFGAGAGWLVSQKLGQSRFCSGIACAHAVSRGQTRCPRCGGELVG